MNPAFPSPLDPVHAFFVGSLGALVGYVVLYRQTRIEQVFQDPRKNWKILLFDLLVYIACGGLVSCFLIEPAKSKEAFEAGLAWQGISGGFVAGTELATYQRAAEAVRGKKKLPGSHSSNGEDFRA